MTGKSPHIDDVDGLALDPAEPSSTTNVPRPGRGWGGGSAAYPPCPSAPGVRSGGAPAGIRGDALSGLKSTRSALTTSRVGPRISWVWSGRPPRPGFAAWRYGDQFGKRRRRVIMLGTGPDRPRRPIFRARHLECRVRPPVENPCTQPASIARNPSNRTRSSRPSPSAAGSPSIRRRDGSGWCAGSAGAGT